MSPAVCSSDLKSQRLIEPTNENTAPAGLSQSNGRIQSRDRGKAHHGCFSLIYDFAFINRSKPDKTCMCTSEISVILSNKPLLLRLYPFTLFSFIKCTKLEVDSLYSTQSVNKNTGIDLLISAG